jgi:hypothetical protein
MTYVPIVPPTPTTPPSPRTRELAGLLGKVMEEYQKNHPATTKGEMRAALRLVSTSLGSDQAARMVALGGVLSLVIGVALFGFFLSRGGDGGGAPVFLPAIVLGLVVVLAVAVLAMKVRS